MPFDSPGWTSRLKNAWYGDVLRVVGVVRHARGLGKKALTHRVDVAVAIPTHGGPRRVLLRLGRSHHKLLSELDHKFAPRKARELAALLRIAASHCQRPPKP